MQIPGFSVSADLEALAWRSTRYAGVRWLPLDESVPGPQGASAEPPEPADATVLIQMDPGSSYPAHRHRGVEEVLVLQGAYSDELGLHETGAYVRYPAGSVHTPVADGDPEAEIGPENPACLLFASARGGVENVPRD